tara:strand:+ start:2035 stop:2454 length:420 start_codon:yes stop_codon:yes gene_type:complete
MKNNTKLIMETWRRFLKEGTEGIDEYGMVEETTDEVDPSELPPVSDADLEGNEDEIRNFYGDDYNENDEDDKFNDPEYMGYNPEEGRDSSVPMLGAPGDDDIEFDDDNTSYESVNTYDPELDTFDNTADKEEYLKYYQK